MKKIALLSTFYFLLLSFVAETQIPPNAFNYSAVARNSSGQPIASTTIGIKITILKTSPNGTSQYSENHFIPTDEFGLFNLVIGAGAVLNGSMATIDWSNDNYFLKVDMDPTGGTNFLTMGTTQLLSVPYALFAKSAGTLSGSGGTSFTHYIGEEYGGGVIFHLWKDNLGTEHGLVLDLADLSTYQDWSNINQNLVGSSAQSNWDGLNNSNAIASQPGQTSSAATLCLNSTNGGQSDWYLPSIQELNMLWKNYYTVSRSLAQISSSVIQHGTYWSSTEFTDNTARAFDFSIGIVIDMEKQNFFNIRAVRAF